MMRLPVTGVENETTKCTSRSSHALWRKPPASDRPSAESAPAYWRMWSASDVVPPFRMPHCGSTSSRAFAPFGYANLYQATRREAVISAFTPKFVSATA